MALIELHFHTRRKDIDMAVSDAFNAQLSRIDAIVSAAVAKQAAADAAEIAQVKQDAADELAALQAKLDAISPPA